MSISSLCRSGGNSIVTFRPIASSAVYPKIRSAPLFQLVITPSSVLLITCVRGGFDDRGQISSTELNLLLFADIAKHQHHAYNFTTIITDWCSTVVDRKTPTGFRNRYRVVR